MKERVGMGVEMKNFLSILNFPPNIFLFPTQLLPLFLNKNFTHLYILGAAFTRGIYFYQINLKT